MTRILVKDNPVADTPASLGYRMPAEWEPQRATWLAWPHNRSDWPGKFEPIPYVYAEIVRHLARSARVELIVNDAAAEARARSILTHANVLGADAFPAMAERIAFHHWPTNRGWLRDSGPIFVKRKPGRKSGGAAGGVAGDVALTQWKFNAWAKYKNWRLDCTLPRKSQSFANAVPSLPLLTSAPARHKWCSRAAQ
jgi:agmatine deiminase